MPILEESPNMYRQLSNSTWNIYCENKTCDKKCGLFHKSEPTNRRFLRDKRAKPADLVAPDKRFHQVSYLNIEELNAIEPITPITVSGSSTITLDDIILSAKRKISEEYIELRIPSPVLIQENDAENALDRHKHFIGGTPWPKDDYNSGESHKEDLSFVEHLVNSSEDEDDLWYNRDPPSIIEEGEQEDFEELLKETKPPLDHYSNPLYRNSDKLTAVRKNKLNTEDDSSSISLSVADISDYEMNYTLLQSRLEDSPTERSQYESNL